MAQRSCLTGFSVRLRNYFISFLVTLAPLNLYYSPQVPGFLHHSLGRNKYKTETGIMQGLLSFPFIYKFTWAFLLLISSPFLHWSPSLCLLHSSGFLQDFIVSTSWFITSCSFTPSPTLQSLHNILKLYPSSLSHLSGFVLNFLIHFFAFKHFPSLQFDAQCRENI